MRLIFSAEALEEVSNSAAYYEEEVEGLGRAFLEAVAQGIARIKTQPGLFRVLRPPYRRHLIRRFPFGIIYRIESETIYVLAVMHLKRRPFYWLKRDR